MGSPGISGFADCCPWWGQGGMWVLRLLHGQGPFLALVTQGSRGSLGPWEERRSETWAPESGEGLGWGP